LLLFGAPPISGAGREAVDAKNEAENMAYQAEKLVNENGDKLAEEDKTALNTKAQAVKDACQKNDADLIKTAKEDLEKTLMSNSLINIVLAH